MRALDEFTDLIDRMEAAVSFTEAADCLTSWAQRITGCGTALLRMAQHDSESGTWLPVCLQRGASTGFLRDEAVVRLDECICGVVASGNVEPSAPYYTPRGSFVWGSMQTIEQEFSSSPAVRGRCLSEGFDSIAIFALTAGEERVGSLHLADRGHEIFDESTQIVERACAVAGRILLRHKQREREHAAFEVIQRALLPPQPPTVAGLDIGLCFSSASDVATNGGDFYDVLDLGTAGVLLVVGDYSGKGIEAAGLAAQARYTIATLARVHREPARLLSAANEALCGVLPASRFVTCAVCLLEPASGRARLALAGHPAPLRLSRGKLDEVPAQFYFPLGLDDRRGYHETETRLDRGDLLLLYTDGVTDARRDGQLFGLEGVAGVCRRTENCAPEPLARAICSESARYHDAETSSSDDRLVLAVCLGGC